MILRLQTQVDLLISLGIVTAKNNQLTWSLARANLALILKHDENREEVHQLRLTIHQASFPLTFNFSLTNKIEHDAYYLISLLIFGFPHHLLWECASFRQHLKVNKMNHINFTVMDVCE